MLPHSSVLKILEPAYAPCDSFRGVCRKMRWEPGAGHAPRGYAGAVGDPSDVKLVLVTAEPGDPYEHESYKSRSPAEMAAQVSEFQYEIYKTSKDLFHKNLRGLIDLFWPGLDFDEQMRHTWITDSVLCSASREGASVPNCVVHTCRSNYLDKQLKLFQNAMIVALGGKARRRLGTISKDGFQLLKGWPKVVHAYSVAPPGCNFRKAKQTWDNASEEFRAFLANTAAGAPDRS